MLFQTIVSRPDFTRIPDWPMPLHVRSAGHYRLPPGFREETHLNENFVQLFWGVSGGGEIVVNGEPFRLDAGDVIWKTSQDTHGYRGGAGEWELRWFTFDGELADDFVSAYGYPRRIEKAGECPAGYFAAIEEGLRKMTPAEFRRLIAVAAAILARAGQSGETEEADRICAQYIELAGRNFADPNADVNTLADQMGMHRTTLTRHFRRVMHASPGEHLRRLRLQQALVLLRDRRLPVAEVARRTGFADPSQFCRAVKKALGRTPGELRGGELAL